MIFFYIFHIPVLCNATTPLYLKRIKRNATQQQNRKKIPKDFVIVQNKKDANGGKEMAEEASGMAKKLCAYVYGICEINCVWFS